MAQFILSAFADEVSPHLAEQIAALKRNGIPCIEPRNIDGGLLAKSDDELKEIKGGASLIALKTKVKIVPFAMTSISSPTLAAKSALS